MGFSFEKLDAYKKSRKLVVEVYKIINRLPQYELYALGSQMRRSAISITSNIAEGNGRMSYKEKIHFIEIACGSLFEVYSQIESCIDLNYINQDSFDLLKPQFYEIARLLSALRKAYSDKLNLKP